MKTNRGGRLWILGAGLAVMVSGTPLIAQIPDPNEVLEAFAPNIPDIEATVYCSNPTRARCDFGDLGGISIGRFNGGQIDAKSNYYLLTGPGIPFDTCLLNNGDTIELREWPITRRSSAGDLEVIGSFSDQCETNRIIEYFPVGFDVDAVNGVMYVEVRADPIEDSTVSRPVGGMAAVFVRITGLPTILDVFPEGPPGPPGSPGPPGPQGPPGFPGMDADESRVVALEQLAVAQQVEIESLRATLEQIENLPTIRKLLEKVEDLEEATP